MADTVQGTPAQAAPQAAPEAPVQPAQQAPKQDPKIDVFVKREKALMNQMRQFKAERQAWEQEKAKYSTSDYIPKSQLTSDPLAILTQHGVTPDKLTEMLLNSQNINDPTVRAMANRIAQMEARLGEQSKRAEEAQQAQYEQARKQISTEVKLLVENNPDFETVKETGMQEAVVELIEQTWEADGYLMDVSEATHEVEKHLLAEAMKLTKLKKLQNQSTSSTPAPASAKPSGQSPLKTITHSATSSNTPTRLTERQRIERAKKAFYGQTTD